MRNLMTSVEHCIHRSPVYVEACVPICEEYRTDSPSLGQLRKIDVVLQGVFGIGYILGSSVCLVNNKFLKAKTILILPLASSHITTRAGSLEKA